MAFRKVNFRKLKQAEYLQQTAIKLHRKGEWEKALEVYEKSLEIFRKLEDKKGISISYNNMGKLHEDKGEWDKALELYEESLKIHKELGDKKGISISYNHLGGLHQNKGEWDKAMEFCEKCLKIEEELEDKKGISDCFNNMGILYQEKGEWDKALELYEKSLKIYEKHEDRPENSDSYNNMGNLYHDKGEWDKALEFYKKSLKIYERLGDMKGISGSYNNIGVLYRGKGEWNKSLEVYERTLKIQEKLGDKKGISASYHNMGILYKEKGEWDKALEFYEESLKIHEELGDKKGISDCYSSLGILYKEKGEWEKALEVYEKCLKIQEKLGDKKGISITFNDLGELNLKNGNWESARKYFNDSLEIAKRLSPISTVSILKNLGELLILEDKYSEAVVTLEESMNIVRDVGAKPLEIDILEKFGDLYISKYIAEEKVEAKNLDLAENNYRNACELAKNLEAPFLEATTIRGLGIVASKKADMDKSEKCFQESFKILEKLGASFELQKTILEYAKILYENNNLLEAEIRAKSVAFDAQKSKNYELLRKVYLLLGDISSKSDDKYEYYLKSLEVAEFNPKIYVRNCYHLIFRMQNMDPTELMKFITLLKGQNKEKYFDFFLESLNNKINGKKYEIGELPRSLAQELENFEAASTSTS